MHSADTVLFAVIVQMVRKSLWLTTCWLHTTLSEPSNPNFYWLFPCHFFSQIFLFGDLNYRITGLELNENLAAIEKKDFSQLLKFDEVSFMGL